MRLNVLNASNALNKCYPLLGQDTSFFLMFALHEAGQPGGQPGEDGEEDYGTRVRDHEWERPPDDLAHGHLRDHRPQDEKVHAEGRGNQGQFAQDDDDHSKPKGIISQFHHRREDDGHGQEHEAGHIHEAAGDDVQNDNPGEDEDAGY